MSRHCDYITEQRRLNQLSELKFHPTSWKVNSVTLFEASPGYMRYCFNNNNKNLNSKCKQITVTK